MNTISSKNSFIKRHSAKIVCFLCFAAVILIQIYYILPLDQPLYGHDSDYHFLRTEALKQRILDRNFFNGGIDYLFYNGAGYASSLAYPDMLLYIPALLRVAGLGIGSAMNIFLIILSVLSYLSMFLCVRKISGSAVCGTIAAAIFSLSQYRLDNMFTRFALGEVQAYIFWPIIICGLYDLIFEDFKKPYILGLSMAGMLLTHTLSTAVAVVLCVIYVLLFIPRLIKKPGKILKLIITAFAVIALTASYWMPLLEFMSSCDLTLHHPVFFASQCAVKFFSLFENITLGLGDPGMGIVIFMLCLPRIALCKKSPICQSLKISGEKRPKIVIAADSFMIIGFLVCFTATDLAPWKILGKVLDVIQFPWRLYALASALIAVAAAIFIYLLVKYTNAQKTGMIIVTFITVLYAGFHLNTINPFHTDKPDDDYYTVAEHTYTVSRGEWLPWAVNQNVDTTRENTDKLILSDGSSVSFGRFNGNLAFDLPEGDYEYADVPFIWYKGYEATDSTGKKLETSMSDIGLVRVDVSDAQGKIIVKYKLTTIKIISEIISIACALILIAAAIIKKVKSNKKRLQTENIQEINNIEKTEIFNTEPTDENESSINDESISENENSLQLEETESVQENESSIDAESISKNENSLQSEETESVQENESSTDAESISENETSPQLEETTKIEPENEDETGNIL